MIRVAVCMYGQPRTWRKCVDWSKEGFKSNSNYQFDFFCEVKDFNTDKYTKGHQQVDEYELDALFQAYAPKSSKINRTYEGIGTFSGTFLSMFDSLLLKQRYEASIGQLYDITLLYRYDLLSGPVSWFTDTFKEPLGWGHIYAGSTQSIFEPEAYKVGLRDVVIIGNSASMDLLGSRLLSNFNPGSDVRKSYDDQLLGPNVILHKHAKDAGFFIHELFVENVIVREHTEVPSNLYRDWHVLQQRYLQDILRQRSL